MVVGNDVFESFCYYVIGLRYILFKKIIVFWIDVFIVVETLDEMDKILKFDFPEYILCQQFVDFFKKD